MTCLIWNIGIIILSSLLVGELIHGSASCLTRKHGQHVFESLKHTDTDTVFVDEVWIYTCDLFGEISDSHKGFWTLQILYYFIKIFIFPISTFIIHRNTLHLRHEWIVFKLTNNYYISVILNDTPPDILTKYCHQTSEAIRYGRRAITHNNKGNNTRVLKHKMLSTRTECEDNQLMISRLSVTDLINHIKSIPSYYDVCNHNCKHVTQALYRLCTG
eukprot:997539_1